MVLYTTKGQIYLFHGFVHYKKAKLFISCFRTLQKDKYFYFDGFVQYERLNLFLKCFRSVRKCGFLIEYDKIGCLVRKFKCAIGVCGRELCEIQTSLALFAIVVLRSKKEIRIDLTL